MDVAASLLLDVLAIKLADEPVNMPAAIRSMLTHPDDADEVGSVYAYSPSERTRSSISARKSFAGACDCGRR